MATSKKKPKLLLCSAVWPAIHKNEKAGNVILHQLLQHTAELNEFDLYFLYLGWDRDFKEAEIPIPNTEDIRGLQSLGIKFVKPAKVITRPRLRTHPFKSIKGLINSSPELLLDGYRNKSVEDSISKINPDAILTVWSDVAASAICHTTPKKFAYHGVPIHRVQESVLYMDILFNPSWIKKISAFIKKLALIRPVRNAHINVMRSFDHVWDIAEIDAKLYNSYGVPSSYINNIWPFTPRKDWENERDQLEKVDPIKICASLGALSATGNSYGFITLARDALPAFKKIIGEGKFELHIFGGKELRPFIKPMLDDPHIKIRGFVDDIDQEIMESAVFLVANNHSHYKGGHTRFLHAWTLGACCVAFDETAESMPEIRHMYNALLAHTPEELAKYVLQAASDRNLRRQLGRNGMATLRDEYSPQKTAGTIAKNILKALET